MGFLENFGFGGGVQKEDLKIPPPGPVSSEENMRGDGAQGRMVSGDHESGRIVSEVIVPPRVGMFDRVGAQDGTTVPPASPQWEGADGSFFISPEDGSQNKEHHLHGKDGAIEQGGTEWSIINAMNDGDRLNTEEEPTLH